MPENTAYNENNFSWRQNLKEGDLIDCCDY